MQSIDCDLSTWNKIMVIKINLSTRKKIMVIMINQYHTWPEEENTCPENAFLKKYQLG